MNTSTLTIIFASILGFSLTLLGAFQITKYFIAHDNDLMQGIIVFSIGIVLFLLVTIALALGKTIIAFGEIMKNQDLLQKEVQKAKDIQAENLSQFGGQGLGALFSGLTHSSSSKGAIIDFSDPDKFNDFLENLNKTKPNNMGINELEEELQKAVDTDDFEKAVQIKKLIELKKNEGSDDDKENDESL